MHLIHYGKKVQKFTSDAIDIYRDTWAGGRSAVLQLPDEFCFNE